MKIASTLLLASLLASSACVARVYQQPYYVDPAPSVVVAPAPVVYGPQPVIITPSPMVVGPPPVMGAPMPLQRSYPVPAPRPPMLRPR